MTIIKGPWGSYDDDPNAPPDLSDAPEPSSNGPAPLAVTLGNVSGVLSAGLMVGFFLGVATLITHPSRASHFFQRKEQKLAQCISKLNEYLIRDDKIFIAKPNNKHDPK